jgi:hypothetical protein
MQSMIAMTTASDVRSRVINEHATSSRLKSSSWGNASQPRHGANGRPMTGANGRVVPQRGAKKKLVPKRGHGKEMYKIYIYIYI